MIDREELERAGLEVRSALYHLSWIASDGLRPSQEERIGAAGEALEKANAIVRAAVGRSAAPGAATPGVRSRVLRDSIDRIRRLDFDGPRFEQSISLGFAISRLESLAASIDGPASAAGPPPDSASPPPGWMSIADIPDDCEVVIRRRRDQPDPSDEPVGEDIAALASEIRKRLDFAEESSRRADAPIAALRPALELARKLDIVLNPAADRPNDGPPSDPTAGPSWCDAETALATVRAYILSARSAAIGGGNIHRELTRAIDAADHLGRILADAGLLPP